MRSAALQWREPGGLAGAYCSNQSVNHYLQSSATFTSVLYFHAVDASQDFVSPHQTMTFGFLYFA